MEKQFQDEVDAHARQELERPPLEEPMYSQEFLAAMEEYAFDTLVKHLQAKGIGKEAVDLLENLYILGGLRVTFVKDKQVRYIWNDHASDVIAGISRAVPALGGHFVTPTGELLEA